MEQFTGIVMERTGKYVVLMTPNGEFKRVRITGSRPDIGEEISIPAVPRRLFNMPRASWLAVAAAVILLLVASPLLTMVNQPPEAAFAYVSVDINPSIELTMSNRYNVMDAQALNQDGEKVLAGVELKGMKVEKAVAKITEQAVKLGFIQKLHRNEVLISVSPLPGARIDRALFERTLLASANNVLEENKVEVAFQTIHVPSKIRENAKKKGLSTGNYAVLVEAVNAGLPLTEKDIKSSSIIAAIASVGGQAERIIDIAREEEQFDLKEQKYLTIASRTGSDVAVTIPVEEQPEPGPVKPGEGLDKPDKDTKLVEPIRNGGGPEERQGGSVNSGSKSKPVSPSPGSPANPVNPVDGTDNAGNNPDSDNTQNDNGDENTNDSYMGPEYPVNQPGNDNNDMHILKPNF